MSSTSSLLALFGLISTNLACPDLTLDGSRMQRSAYIDRRRIPPDSCAIYECGTGVGSRLLLRFDGAIPNVGTSDLHMGNPSPSLGFVWDDCHRHYHWNHFMDYQVFHYDNISNPYPIMTGEKRAFCLRDDGVADRSILGQYGVTPRYVQNTYDCDNQGIHAGYQDVYGRDLECQWIDVTNLPRGRYKMRAEVNPQRPQGSRLITECRYDNNVAWIEFDTPGGPAPTPQPEPSPRTRRDGRGSNNRWSWFSFFGRNDGSDYNSGCTRANGQCSWSSDCCGDLRCQRARFASGGTCG